MLRFMPYVYALILLIETIALTAIYILAPPASSDPLSLWLGTLGLLSMIVMLVDVFHENEGVGAVNNDSVAWQ